MANILSFDVDVVHFKRALYEGLISNMIDGLADPAVPPAQGRPVLPPLAKAGQNIPWFDILLKDTDQNVTVTLKLRRDNLYLQGYQAKNGSWFELGTRRLMGINDSTLVGLSENYAGLLVAAGYDPTGGLTEVNLPNYQRLVQATNYLATETSVRGRDGQLQPARNTKQDQIDRAKTILTLVLLFCEATRSIPTLNYLASKFSDESARGIPGWVDKIAHKWGQYSALCIVHRNDPNFKLSTNEQLDIPGGIDARKVGDLRRVIGICQNNPNLLEFDDLLAP